MNLCYNENQPSYGKGHNVNSNLIRKIIRQFKLLLTKNIYVNKYAVELL